MDTSINYNMPQTREAKKISNQKYRAKFYECPCGSTIKLISKADHIKTPKHQRFIDNNEPLTNLLRITEYDNQFQIKCKLPNGELFRIKRRFQISNKEQVMIEMDAIRQAKITEHYPNRI